jgi:hypothetical protein
MRHKAPQSGTPYNFPYSGWSESIGLYFRKRIGLGPLALNFSKSGIGISTGVRGLALESMYFPSITSVAK